MKWSIISAVCIAVLGFIPLMGLPGAVVLEIGQFFAGFFGITLRALKGDAAWPAAIYATFFWPVTIPLACYIAFRRMKDANKPVKWSLFVFILLVGALIVTALIESLARSGK